MVRIHPYPPCIGLSPSGKALGFDPSMRSLEEKVKNGTSTKMNENNIIKRPKRPFKAISSFGIIAAVGATGTLAACDLLGDDGRNLNSSQEQLDQIAAPARTVTYSAYARFFKGTGSFISRLNGLLSYSLQLPADSTITNETYPPLEEAIAAGTIYISILVQLNGYSRALSIPITVTKPTSVEANAILQGIELDTTDLHVSFAAYQRFATSGLIDTVGFISELNLLLTGANLPGGQTAKQLILPENVKVDETSIVKDSPLPTTRKVEFRLTHQIGENQIVSRPFIMTFHISRLSDDELQSFLKKVVPNYPSGSLSVSYTEYKTYLKDSKENNFLFALNELIKSGHSDPQQATLIDPTVTFGSMSSLKSLHPNINKDLKLFDGTEIKNVNKGLLVPNSRQNVTFEVVLAGVISTVTLNFVLSPLTADEAKAALNAIAFPTDTVDVNYSAYNRFVTNPSLNFVDDLNRLLNSSTPLVLPYNAKIGNVINRGESQSGNDRRISFSVELISEVRNVEINVSINPRNQTEAATELAAFGTLLGTSVEPTSAISHSSYLHVDSITRPSLATGERTIQFRIVKEGASRTVEVTLNVGLLTASSGGVDGEFETLVNESNFPQSATVMIGQDKDTILSDEFSLPVDIIASSDADLYNILQTEGYLLGGTHLIESYVPYENYFEAIRDARMDGSGTKTREVIGYVLGGTMKPVRGFKNINISSAVVWRPQ
ncbi:unnamed protein product [Didymodactylos carnosus]|uniref:Uncharacterized protein n=1 Tax=Didymodactylos carnosus TaxID=1234261 RepID=A0A8S2K4E0_9BILA|nr:unnamed protein product [Didymodactylos carnosus]CAF3834655.1 unnamed protein product [Didymodactylos carnosus]